MERDPEKGAEMIKFLKKREIAKLFLKMAIPIIISFFLALAITTYTDYETSTYEVLFYIVLIRIVISLRKLMYRKLIKPVLKKLGKDPPG